jgi:UDP-4-amino-4,6-dideoxy-N-acetyl-beta-L-altrosamine N-acetyltransferase
MTNSDDHLRPLHETDLERVLQWRNHPGVRRHMYGQHVISMSEHRAWFEASKRNEARHLYIFELGDTPSGFLNISETVKGRIADWGFYLSPDAPSGSGQRLGRLALFEVFERKGLHKLCGQVIEFNDKSIRFHERLGFTREGRLRDQYYDGERYNAVIHFGLLAQEWRDGLTRKTI